MNSSVLTHFAWAVQISLGIVFLFSSISKLRDPLTFARNVALYKILPSSLAIAFGIALIPLELGVAIGFFTGVAPALMNSLAFGLLVLFLIAVGVNLYRGRSIACGCFGNTAEQISLRTIARIVLLLGAVLFLFLAPSSGGLTLFILDARAIDATTVLYVLQTFFTVAVLILFSAWTLNLPELVAVMRYAFRRSMPVDTSADAS